MIRSPHAFLVSLSLHLLIGLFILAVVAPKMVSEEAGESTRCRIALSHIVPTFSELVEKSVTKPVQAEKKKMPTATKPVVKTIPVKSVPTQIVPDVREEKAFEPAAAAAVEKETLELVASENLTDLPETAVQPLPEQSGKSYLDEHLAVIARLLQENLYYPKLARKRHIEGEVMAAFTLLTDGTIKDVTVKKHAREVLDRAAVRTIESLSGQMPHPQTVLTLEVPIRFVLK